MPAIEQTKKAVAHGFHRPQQGKSERYHDAPKKLKQEISLGEAFQL